MKKSLLWAIPGLFLVIFVAWMTSASAPSEPTSLASAPSFSRDHLNIRRADGVSFPFDVEIATTSQQEAYGLMFRHSIAPQTGMLFLWDPDREVSMWMKNTYISLDMLFIRHDGTIAKIITHAIPLNLTPLSSDEPVHSVMEMKAGEVDRLGLKAGDKVVFWAFQMLP